MSNVHDDDPTQPGRPPPGGDNGEHAMRDEGDDAYPTDEFVGGALQRLARSLRLTAADLERAGADIASGSANLAALEETVERVSDLRGQRDGIESGLMHILTVLRNRRSTP